MKIQSTLIGNYEQFIRERTRQQRVQQNIKALEFQGYYDGVEFKKLRDKAEAGEQEIQITLPDGVVISFTGDVSVAIGELAVAEATTFTMSVTPKSEISFNYDALAQ